MTLSFYNTLTRKTEPFTPADAKNVRMYVCGPTVYDRPHLGNARSVVVYDVLYRLLMQTYGKEHVTYVRNITDVDDKINAAALANGEPISALTTRITQFFHDDMDALGCLRPTHEPRATAHIAQMIVIIEKLIASGNAYVSQGHVLFAVDSYKEYGALSGRKLDELIAGARIEVEGYKKHPGDFVLWKPADAGDDPSSVFDSPWGAGRPGWHIECSAMSSEYLGDDFDIHGGGADLMFPHHENEIAQSRCSAPHSHFATTWIHNGFLTVHGEKMSKSLGNFTTVRDLLNKGIKGEVIRLALLSAHYRKPLDWNEKLVSDAQKTLDHWYGALNFTPPPIGGRLGGGRNMRDLSHHAPTLALPLMGRELSDDLNLPASIAQVGELATRCHKEKSPDSAAELLASANLLGLLQQSPDAWFKGDGDDSAILAQIDARKAAKAAKNWAEADAIRKSLADNGILLEDRPDGTTDWRRA